MAANNIPTALVVFGATGDLMTKKITPALYNLFTKNKLPKLFRVIGYARRPLTDEQFREHVSQILRTNKHIKKNQKELDSFLKRFVYKQGQFEVLKDYESLAEDLGRVDQEWKVCSNKLFYTAVPPEYYQGIFQNLHNSGLTIPCGPDEGWTRVLVEKPFGKDATTAEKLDMKLAQLFKEEQIYRIDHYLAKEMLQNILSFRFSNNLFEQSWSNKYIEKISIKLLEKIGVEKRGLFYDGVGALRDVGQNHLLQMLALVTMEHPTSFSSEKIREKRNELLKCLIPPSLREIKKQTVRAQYAGYQYISGVKKSSQTETFFRIRGYLDSPRWQGVPIVMTGGKRLKNQIKNITITFKHSSPCLCPVGKKHIKDKIIFSLEPEEKIELHFLAKKPGLEMEIEKRKFEFTYRKRERSGQYVEEYEKLLLDSIEGNQILFLSTDEVKSMWKYIDPIARAWEKNIVPLEKYIADSDDMIKQLKIRYEASATEETRAEHLKQKEIGVIGLGKMGGNVARNLLGKKWRVVGWNRTYSVSEGIKKDGMVAVQSIEELVKKLPLTPRVIWLMLPAGQVIDNTLKILVKLLKKGDLVIDAANSNYKDTIRRSVYTNKHGINFVDVGFSGGPGGALLGGCLMVGGTKALFEQNTTLYNDLAIASGVMFFEGVGAGHFTKMVHNGIEYGMMQALAEGFNVIHDGPYKIDLKKAAQIYNHGSVIESRLTNWLESAYRMYGSDLTELSGSTGSGGGGAGERIKGEADWTVDVAKELKIPAVVIEESVSARIKSVKSPNYQAKVINALRNQFGGHKAK